MDIEKQHEYITTFKIDPIEVGMLCDKYPGLKNTWSQFMTMLEICKDDKYSVDSK
jgi:hypothetical protein